MYMVTSCWLECDSVCLRGNRFGARFELDLPEFLFMEFFDLKGLIHTLWVSILNDKDLGVLGAEVVLVAVKER